MDDLADRDSEVVAEDNGCSLLEGEVENSAEAEVSVPVKEAETSDRMSVETGKWSGMYFGSNSSRP